MTAYELSDWIESSAYGDYTSAKEAANMLRQQADRIAELEETINACYSVQKMQAEEVYKGNDRIAELEKEAEDWEKATKWMEMVRQVPTKPLSNAELDIEIVKLAQGKHATMRDMLRAIEERHGIK